MLIDTEDDGEEQGNLSEQSVTELSNAIKRTVEDRFGLVRVKGEIGRVSRPRSGHVYLSLKDDRSVIDGVMWKGVAARIAVKPEEGMEAVVTGRLTTFGGQSKYQIVIDHLAPAGAGALMAMLDARRRAFEAEGLFAADRKRRIPLIPKTVGVVTSPSGAVIRDILHRLGERFPCDVLVWSVAVQGKGSAEQVAAAIRGFDALEPGGAVPRPDVLIVARGGGSIEDLWGFNEEVVVRAAAECRIPLISAIGHETDTTLLDHVADLRAPTPTGAAEKAVPVRSELMAQVNERGGRRLRAMERSLGVARDGLRQSARLLPKPDALIADRRQGLDIASQALSRGLLNGLATRRSAMAQARASLRPVAMKGRLREVAGMVSALSARLSPERLRQALASRMEGVASRGGVLERQGRALLTERRRQVDAMARMVEAVSYQRVLDRGFAVVSDVEGRVIKSPEGVIAGTTLDIAFAGDRHLAAVAGKGALRGPVQKSKPRRTVKPSPPPEDDARDLFDFS